MNILNSSTFGEKDSCSGAPGALSMTKTIGRIEHHFLNDPKSKFILTGHGEVLNANTKASNLLASGFLTRLPNGTLSYGSLDLNGAVEEILDQLRFGRASCMKLLKRVDDDWASLDFSIASYNNNKEILLTIHEPNDCHESALRALTRAFGFTITEAEVVRHMSKASSPKEISAEMDISTNTVRAHLRSIYSKTGVRGYNRALRVIMQFLN